MVRVPVSPGRKMLTAISSSAFTVRVISSLTTCAPTGMVNDGWSLKVTVRSVPGRVPEPVPCSATWTAPTTRSAVPNRFERRMRILVPPRLSRTCSRMVCPFSASAGSDGLAPQDDVQSLDPRPANCAVAGSETSPTTTRVSARNLGARRGKWVQCCMVASLRCRLECRGTRDAHQFNGEATDTAVAPHRATECQLARARDGCSQVSQAARPEDTAGSGRPRRPALPAPGDGPRAATSPARPPRRRRWQRCGPRR